MRAAVAHVFISGSLPDQVHRARGLGHATAARVGTSALVVLLSWFSQRNKSGRTQREPRARPRVCARCIKPRRCRCVRRNADSVRRSDVSVSLRAVTAVSCRRRLRPRHTRRPSQSRGRLLCVRCRTSATNPASAASVDTPMSVDGSTAMSKAKPGRGQGAPGCCRWAGAPASAGRLAAALYRMLIHGYPLSPPKQPGGGGSGRYRELEGGRGPSSF